MLPAVRVVILNFNGGEHVLRSVEHACSLDWPADRLEVVVVDNASTDGSARRIERRFPGVRVLHSARNTGFSANNFGLRDLDDAAYVALVNPDAFVEPGWLRPLVEEMEADPSLGGACPRMLLASRFVDLEISSPPHRTPGRELGVRVSGLRVDGADVLDRLHVVSGAWGAEADREGGRYHWTEPEAVLGVPCDGDVAPTTVAVRLDADVAKDVVVGGATVAVDETPTWFDVPVTGEAYDVVNNAGSLLVEGGWGADRGLGERDGPEFDEARDVFAWCGGGVLLRATYLRDVGLFDEDFFLYYEDTDLSWRGRGRGWRYRYVPTARMRHVHAATTVVGSSLFIYNVERNRLVMLLKNAPAMFVLGAAARFLRSTVGIAREQVLSPIRSGHRPDVRTTLLRLQAFLGFLAAVPRTLPVRRSIRRAMTVPDRELLGWQVPQP